MDFEKYRIFYVMSATQKLILVLFSAVVFLGVVKTSYAASEDACAIWICLPGGFPQGCSGAYSEFKHRIKKGRPPLPELSSCTTGPDGEKVSGHYQLGYERYEPCEDGYVLRESRIVSAEAKCYMKSCAPVNYTEHSFSCQNYPAVLREKPNFVKMWVDGEYLGQFFY